MLQVLVVDDDEIVRRIVARAIADAGHGVTEACDGEAALSVVATRTFDLAICDVQMPRLGGHTVLRRLRRDSLATVVVIMTSYPNIPDAVAMLRDGATDYVIKPFDPEEFVVNVVGPIAQRRALIR